MSAPWFERAIASKALVVTSLLCTGTAVYLDLHFEELGSKKVTMKNLLASQTTFRKVMPDMLFGLSLLYVFRHLEREFGTRKFVSFCATSSTVSVSLQLAIVSFLSLLEDGRTLSAGPYAPIFSLLILYIVHVPAISSPMSGNLRMNSKLPVYGMAAMLALDDGTSSLIPSICGLIGGLVAYSQLKWLNVPDALAKFGKKYLEPLFRSNPRPIGGAGAGVGGRGRQPAGYERDVEDDVLLPTMFGGPAPEAAVNAVPEPSQEDIATLVAMGFDNNAARAALRRTRNDVNRAAESLLNES